MHYKRQTRGAPLDWKPKGALWHYARKIVKSVRSRARASGLEFSIDTEWFLERLRPGVCEVTGLPLKMEESARTPWSASLDRIVPDRGYTKENVRVVCWMMNAAKGEHTDEDVMTFARALLSKQSIS